MAGYDPGRYDEVMHWPLRELLLARAAQVHEGIVVDLRHRQLMVALRPGGGKGKAAKMPNPPRFLKRPLA